MILGKIYLSLRDMVVFSIRLRRVDEVVTVCGCLGCCWLLFVLCRAEAPPNPHPVKATLKVVLSFPVFSLGSSIWYTKTLFSSLLQTPAEQAKVRMQMVLQAAGKCINPANVRCSLIWSVTLNREAVCERTVGICGSLSSAESPIQPYCMCSREKRVCQKNHRC